MDAPVVSIEFTGEDMDMILKYMDAIEAVTVQAAILNAISLALDHADDPTERKACCKDCEYYGSCHDD